MSRILRSCKIMSAGAKYAKRCYILFQIANTIGKTKACCTKAIGDHLSTQADPASYCRAPVVTLIREVVTPLNSLHVKEVRSNCVSIMKVILFMVITRRRAATESSFLRLSSSRTPKILIIVDLKTLHSKIKCKYVHLYVHQFTILVLCSMPIKKLNIEF